MKGKLKEALRKQLEDVFGKIKKGLEQEGRETKEMLKIYLKFTRNEATKAEMKRANKQFRDFLKTIGFGVLAALPLAFLTIPLAVKWGKKVGIDIIPTSFKE